MLKEYKLNWTLDRNINTSDTKDATIYQLIEESANDSNSSKFREDVTKWMVGLETSESKKGYDDDFAAIEVKPQNFTGRAKLCGKGQFNDFTWKRDKKYNKDGVVMLISGFSYGKLVFIIEFPYSSIRKTIKEKLKKHLPNGDEVNRYVRTCGFTYTTWKDEEYKIRYVTPDLEKYKECIVKGFYNILKD
jgi:hypothetical protein